MKLEIKKGEIIVGRLYLKISEFKFICGALNSVINCKKKEILLLPGALILKNTKYEVRLAQFYEEEMNNWREKLHILEPIIPFRCSLPIFPISKVIEIRSKGKEFVKWECDCGCKAERSNFIFDESSQKYLCPLCQRDPSHRHY